MQSPNILLAHSGKQHAYHVAKAMLDLGVLGRFVTSSYVSSPWLQDFIESKDILFLKRRFEHGLAAPKVQSNWRFELPELVVRSMVGNSRTVNNLIFKRDRDFDRYVSRRVLDRRRFNCYWGFQGSSLDSINKARAEGLDTVCEMTLSHVPFANRLLKEEQQLLPEWADSIDFTSFPGWYEQRLIEEPHSASKVVAISAFLKKTLLSDGVEDSKIAVLPLGFDISKMKFIDDVPPIGNRPLRLLYAGRVTQRKGIAYLLESIKAFNKSDVELHIIGDVFGSGKAFRSYSKYFHHRPAIGQAELFRTYCEFDALVFPSLLEGFGLVNVEAMGAGLPVITTPNTNAAEVLEDGENGFVVPIRDSGAITDAITRLRNMDDNAYRMMRLRARITAEQFTWSNYRQRLAAFLNIPSLD